MFSILRTIWYVFLHSFQKRITVQYPEQKPYLAPRFRGRIILSRDPDGGERCVACNLCAVACPVDCIALHLLRLLRRGLSDLRYPTYAGLRDGRVSSEEPGL
jgi:formate hydrogenlyase subunit 6/NADH:ubiquinone oxidoreductase subunit I